MSDQVIPRLGASRLGPAGSEAGATEVLPLLGVADAVPLRPAPLGDRRAVGLLAPLVILAVLGLGLHRVLEAGPGRGPMGLRHPYFGPGRPCRERDHYCARAAGNTSGPRVNDPRADPPGWPGP